MKTNEQERIEDVLRRDRFVSTLKVIAVVGIGAGLYGFKLGRQSGMSKGIEAGYIIAGGDMIEALKEHAQELRLSRGGE